MTPRPKSGPSMRKLELCDLFWRVLGILRGQVWLSKSSKNRRKTFTNSLQKLMPEMLWILCKRSPELMPKRSQKSTRKLTKNRTDDFSIFVNSITLKSFFRTIAGTWIEAKMKKNEDRIDGSEMYHESIPKLIEYGSKWQPESAEKLPKTMSGKHPKNGPEIGRRQTN